MPLVTDWTGKVIQITSPDIDVDAQTLHDYIEDQMASARGSSEDDIINPQGKIEDPTSPGEASQIIIILNSPWQIQFWQGSGYTRIFGGKIIGGLNDQPMKATGAAGDITVLQSPVDGLTISEGGQIQPLDETTFHQYLDSSMKLAEILQYARNASDNAEQANLKLN